jgi:penicillin-binding protein 1C
VEAVASCWPLGLRAAATEPALCLQRRSGWALGGAVPPTLPERERSDGLLLAAGHCPDGTARPARVRWPAALVPWLEARGPAACPGATPPAGRLRIVGLDDGSALRAAPGQQRVDVSLWAEAADDGSVAATPVYWLVDGEQQRRTRPGEAWTLRLTQPGGHTITALDGAGRHQSLSISVAGL